MLKRFISILLISLVVVGAAIALSPAKSADTGSRVEASVFESISDFLRNLIPERSTSTNKVSEPTPLYKPVIDYEEAVTSAVEDSLPSVVSIAIRKDVQTIEQCIKNFGPFQISEPCPGETQNIEIGEGSGFIVSEDGLVVTNKHVVRDQGAEYTVFTNDGKSYEAEVLDRDPVQDIAIIKINAEGLRSLDLGDSESIKLGQTAIAIGNSLGEFKNTVSVGVVSGLARDITAAGSGFVERIEGVIQTDAAINQGNSGGPLINLKGKAIGMNTAVAQNAQNIGFAIPVNRIKRDIESVKKYGEIKTPFLGVRYRPITKQLQEEESLPVDYGVLVRGTENGPAVTLESGADKAGIRAEDIILEINGTKVSEENSLGSLIQKQNIGDTIDIKILRNGEELTLQATLGERPDF